MPCEQCEWWKKPAKDRGPEVFEFCWGLALYNIDKARRIMKRSGRAAVDGAVSNLAPHVAYPKTDTIDIVKIYVNDEHVDHVSLDEPVILAYDFKPRPGDEKTTRSLIIIDGAHRIAKAVKLGLPSLKCFVLTEEETDKVLTDNRPRKRKS